MQNKTGVSFDDTHSYRDWGLRLKKIKNELPKAKTEYVSVPGMNGDLDLTEAQNGGLVYEMRTLELTFDARNCNYSRWAGLTSRIAKSIHGKKCRIVIDTDSGYYYYGRCNLNTSKTNEVTAEIVINCYCDPYKIDVTSSNDPWIWDTFSFIDGIIRATSEINIDSGATGWQRLVLVGWEHNETIKIISNSDMLLKYRNGTYSLSTGENIMYDIEIFEGENELFFQGTGTITIVHRGGTL